MLASLIKRIFRGRHSNEDWTARVAMLQQTGRYAEAAAVCEARLARDVRDVDALQALAAVLLAQGRSANGLETLKKAAALAPRDARVHATLGQVSAAVGLVDEAIRSYRHALALEPGRENVTDDLLGLLKASGSYDEVEDRCRASLADSGDSARRRRELAGALFEQGRVEEAITELRASLALAPDAPAVHSELLRMLNYVDGTDADTLFHAHCEWARRHETPLAHSASGHGGDADPDRRLRVGYVSPYFRKHAVTFFLESVIEHHDRVRFEVVLFADVPHPDEFSARLEAHGAQWHSTVGLSDEALAQRVRDERIDILVDLTGHMGGHRLLAFARRPAPVQVTWNGYPNTTGMAAMNYRITDALCDPPGQTERLYSERLTRLPGIYMSWRPPQDAPEPGPPPAASSGRVTFGSFNSCYKLTPTVIGLWARILEETKDSRLVLFAVPGGRAEGRLRAQFAALGVESGRIDIRPRVSHEAFLEAHREVDIALDSFPYHGTTTTCFSLWMGVPVVCLTGSSHRSRVGLTLLSSIGCAHLAPSTPKGYVETAAALARDIEGLRQFRGGLRQRMLGSSLTDGATCADALAHAYRAMWNARCSARSASRP